MADQHHTGLHNFTYHPNVANWVQSTSLATQVDGAADAPPDPESDSYYHPHPYEPAPPAAAADDMTTTRQRQVANGVPPARTRPSPATPQSQSTSRTPAKAVGQGSVKALAQRFNQVSSTESSPASAPRARPARNFSATRSAENSANSSPARPTREAAYGPHKFTNLKPRERPQPSPATPSSTRRAHQAKKSLDEQASPSRSKVASPARSRKESTGSARKPFFGEVVGHHDASSPGFGIPNVDVTPNAAPTTQSATFSPAPNDSELSPEPLFSQRQPKSSTRTPASAGNVPSNQSSEARRHSPPSRIPVPRRPPSATSDSSSSTRSARGGTTMRSKYYNSPSKNPNLYRRPGTGNVSHQSPASKLPAANYRGYRERGKSPQPARGGPTLAAVISTKPPPTSPRLRHSHERQLRPQAQADSAVQSDDPFNENEPSDAKTEGASQDMKAENAQPAPSAYASEPSSGGHPSSAQVPTDMAQSAQPPQTREGLSLQTSSLHAPVVAAPLSSTTEFEYEESPVLGMPGSFVATPPMVQASPPMPSKQEAPATIAPELVESQQPELLQPHVFQSSSKATAGPDSSLDDIDQGVSELSLRESIPIMLGENESQLGAQSAQRPVLSPRLSIGSQQYRAEHLDDSGTISYLEEEDSPNDRHRNRDTLRPEDSASVAFYQSQDSQQNQWTPRMPALPDHGALDIGTNGYRQNEHAQPGGLTLSSEAYSVIIQVLNEYHRSPRITPEVAYDSMKRVHAVSPIVAQHQDWDSKDSTETYLARLLSDATFVGPEQQDMGDTCAENETPTGTVSGTIPGLSIYGLDDDLEYAGEGGGTAIIYPPESTRYSRSSANSSATTIHDADGRAGSSSERLSRDTYKAGYAVSPTLSFTDERDSASTQPQPPPKDWRKPLPPSAARPAPLSSDHPAYPIPARSSSAHATGERETDGHSTTRAFPPRPPPPKGPPPPPPVAMLHGHPNAYQPLMLTRSGTQGRSAANKKPRPRVAGDNDESTPLLADSAAASRSTVADVAPEPTSETYPSDQQSFPSNHTPVAASSESSKSAAPDTRVILQPAGPPNAPPPVPTRTTSALFPNEDPETYNKRLRRRYHTLRELVDTELMYSKDMTIIKEIWLSTAEKPLPDPRDRRILFSNSEEIAAFSYQLWIDLLEAVQPIFRIPPPKWDWEKTPEELAKDKEEQEKGKAPVEDPDAKYISVTPENDDHTSVGYVLKTYLADIERLYTVYLLNHDAANKLIMDRQSDPVFLGWQLACYNHSKDLTEAWDANSLMIKPTQRMMKYPLLLKELIAITPPTHDDYADLVAAHKGCVEINEKINEAKKRQDTLREATKEGKKEKKKGLRGLAVVKALTNKSDKAKPVVTGVSEPFSDEEYDALSQKFGGHFFQLQVIIRDLDKFRDEVTACFLHLNIVVIGFIQILDAAPPSQSPEIESAWRRNAMALLELRNVLLEDHKEAVKQRIMKPLLEIWQAYVNPEKLMGQRKKGLPQFLRYRQALDRKDKIDPKLEEAALSFQTVNDSLKRDLPKLYDLTKKGVQTILKSFVNYQLVWWKNCQKKILPLLEVEPEHTTSFEYDMEAYVARFKSDADSIRNIMNRLALINGNLTQDLASYASPLPSIYTADDSSSRKSSSRRTESIGSEVSMVESRKRRSGGHRGNGSFDQQVRGPPPVSGPGYWTPPYGVPFGDRGPSSRPHTQQRDVRGISSSAQSDSTTAGSGWAGVSAAMAESRDMIEFQRIAAGNDIQAYYNTPAVAASLLSPSSSMPGSSRGSTIFNSALPMPDSPTANRSAEDLPTTPADPDEPEVLFLAASLFEFNIAHDRLEGGIPYLVYVPGEVFDVIGMKGELWLARNQDDQTRTVGWIWEKHFARILPEEM